MAVGGREQRNGFYFLVFLAASIESNTNDPRSPPDLEKASNSIATRDRVNTSRAFLLL